MNRQQRRGNNPLGDLNTPVTITEAVQISRGVAEDVLSDYQQRNNSLQVAMSLQVEILKEVVLSSGLITEEEFRASYMEKVDNFKKLQEEEFNRVREVFQDGISSDAQNDSENTPKMSSNVTSIEVNKK